MLRELVGHDPDGEAQNINGGEGGANVLIHKEVEVGIFISHYPYFRKLKAGPNFARGVP